MNTFYIAVDFYGWAQGDSIEEANSKRANDSGKQYATNIWEVKGDPKMLYSFLFFCPQIEGAELVATVQQEKETGRWQLEHGFFGRMVNNPVEGRPNRVVFEEA